MPSIPPKPAASPTPPERLVRRTGYGLAVTTLLLTVALLAGVGFATAAVAIRSTDASVDRSLRDASTAAIAYLELFDVDASPTPGPTAANTPPWSERAEPTDTPEASDEGEGSEEGQPAATPSSPGSTDNEQENEQESEAPDGRAPAKSPAIVLAGTIGPAPSANPPPLADVEPDDQPPAASDTFFLVLDGQGHLLSNPRRVLLSGLPDTAAAAAAAANGEDWRTVTADGVPVRLFTRRVSDGRGGPPALLQSGMVLSLQEVQRNEILMTIILASLVGLLGAGLVTVLVTRRALSPVRSAFAAERRFVAAASHELRTPVTVLHALAEVLQREGLVKPEGSQMVADMISETDRLGRLVGDLLALSSAEAGAVIVDWQPVEARTFVADLARRVASVAAGRGLSLVVEQAESSQTPELVVVTDPDRLAQLLVIFVDNAIEHSPAGGQLRLSVRLLADRGHDRVADCGDRPGAGRAFRRAGAHLRALRPARAKRTRRRRHRTRPGHRAQPGGSAGCHSPGRRRAGRRGDL